MNKQRRLAGKKIWHEQLLRQGRIDEAKRYAAIHHLFMDRHLDDPEQRVTTPGGAGVAPPEGPDNGDSSSDPLKISAKGLSGAGLCEASTGQRQAHEQAMARAVTEADRVEEWLNRADTRAFVAQEGAKEGLGQVKASPVLAGAAPALAGDGQPHYIGGDAKDNPAVVLVGGVAREVPPAGVKWGQVIGEYPNWMFKRVRLLDGQEGRLWVTRRLSEKHRGRLMWEWVMCCKTREPDKAGDWCVWDGPVRR